MAVPAILRTAHGTAAEGGALLVAETPPLDELGTPNAARTAEGLALATRRGRPFQDGNAAASGRGPSLTRIAVPGSVDEDALDDLEVCDPDSKVEKRRSRRKAFSLLCTRRRELEIETGGPLSTAAKVELVSWARATAWAELYDRAGDGVRSTAFAKDASAFGLKAQGYAERWAAAHAGEDKDNKVEKLRARILGMGKKKT